MTRLMAYFCPTNQTLERLNLLIGRPNPTHLLKRPSVNPYVHLTLYSPANSIGHLVNKSRSCQLGCTPVRRNVPLY